MKSQFLSLCENSIKSNWQETGKIYSYFVANFLLTSALIKTREILPKKTFEFCKKFASGRGVEKAEEGRGEGKETLKESTVSFIVPLFDE